MDNKNSSLKKILYGVLLFIPFLYVYYFLVGIIVMIPLYFVGGAESGLWAYAIIIGLACSPVLSIMTIRKILSKK